MFNIIYANITCLTNNDDDKLHAIKDKVREYQLISQKKKDDEKFSGEKEKHVQ